MKYKTIREYGIDAFNYSVVEAIRMGWEPCVPATVNAETNSWFIIMRRAG